MKNTSINKEILTQINKLYAVSDNFITEDISIEKIETSLLSHLLSVGLSLLEHILEEKKHFIKTLSKDYQLDTKYKNTGIKTRKYLSLFGLLTIERNTIFAQGIGNIFVLDELLQLPNNTKLSYNIQKLLGENASENNFNESVNLLNKLLGLNLSGKMSERNVSHLGSYVDSYYTQNPVAISISPVCFSASFDGKGVPKIKNAIAKKGNPKSRLGKGEKRGTKEMATVSVISSFTPKNQCVSNIISTLMGDNNIEKKVVESKEKNDNKWHKDVHRRAFLANQNKAIDYGINNIKDRMQHPDSRFVVPIDAGPGLEDAVLSCVNKYGLSSQFDGIILDIIHVSEYVWKVGTILFGEKSTKRAIWVRKILTSLLNGQVNVIIEILKDQTTKKSLSQLKKDKIEKVITYFTNHKHKMNYKKFIEKGYPISSALAESTCGYLVKDRMEQSGMRWSSKGAQNMLDLRAVKLNGNMESFINFVNQKERKVILKLVA